ncbi:MAG: 30S ribosomal protein S8 [Ignavibacteria bacterium CG2_30_36_16]|jgi:small subunit ribosomal protein S8|nr:30S ribosomal protein S8 [Ignavibacteria bacterium]OIP61009.1 MAG: 30S ribosomal protein S8 [Ignavibacteria bacterium CG2_30_36_16]PJB01051.1 MAG: 30S ribosomal protein S8 [Ignavibacteria bacterium CG_4_9_14_3_um_filter_36_18]
MAVTDPIADYLTRVRNASSAKKIRVDIPSSHMKISLSEILKKYNFIEDYAVVEDNKQNIIRIVLKYRNGIPALSGLKRISKPGLRIYKNSDELPRVLNGLGIAIISTSKGLLSDKEARSSAMGGEIVCHIW